MSSTEERASKKQRELLSFVDSFIKGNGYGPSYREIMRALGYKSVSTVAIHIDNLIVKGYLIKRTHSARSLEVITTDITADTRPASLAESSHREWLLNLILDKIGQADSYNEDNINEFKTLVESLKVLGFIAEHKKAESKLEGYISGANSQV